MLFLEPVETEGGSHSSAVMRFFFLAHVILLSIVQFSLYICLKRIYSLLGLTSRKEKTLSPSLV